jgi:hypothetical protein
MPVGPGLVATAGSMQLNCGRRLRSLTLATMLAGLRAAQWHQQSGRIDSSCVLLDPVRNNQTQAPSGVTQENLALRPSQGVKAANRRNPTNLPRRTCGLRAVKRERLGRD